MIPGILAGYASNFSPTPQNTYGSNLLWLFDAAQGTADLGTVNATWQEQVNGTLFEEDVASGSITLESNYFNNLPAIQFYAESSGNTGKLVESSASYYDNMWGGAGNKNIAFAMRKEDNNWVDGVTAPIFIHKGENNHSPALTGWRIGINQQGDLEFKAKTSSYKRWRVYVPGYYLTRTEVIGHITFDGVFSTSPNITIRLWSGSAFVTVPHVFSGSSLTMNDSAAILAIGNQSSDTFRENWAGGIGVMWFTKPALTSINEAYLSNFI